MTPTIKAFGQAVVIGLGGTGQKALLQIKKHFMDTCDGKVPQSVKLLSFDTDQQERPLRSICGQEVKLSDNEFCRLSVDKVKEAIKSPYVQDWWIKFPSLDNTAITDGAGGVREAGRLALFCCISQVCTRITLAYNSMQAFDIASAMMADGFELLDGSPQVIVIGSLAGGTGGGMFVDMSLLCRNLGGEEFKYMAYILMPWVYKSLANTAYENTYAGLVEMNRLAKLNASNSLRIRYSDGRDFILDECPFHIVNLVDGQCANGERLAKAEDLVTFIAESVYHLTGALGAPARSVYDNIISLKNGLSPSDWDGSSAIYSTIGVSTIRYPAPEMHRAVVCQRTADMLHQIRQEIVAAATSVEQTPPEVVEAVEAIVQQYNLRPDPNKKPGLGLFAPAGGIARVELDNDDFSTLETRDDVLGLVNPQAIRICQLAGKAFAERQLELQQTLWNAIKETLDKKPLNQQQCMLATFIATLAEFANTLTRMTAIAHTVQTDAESRKHAARDRFPAQSTMLGRMTGRMRACARTFVDAANVLIDAELTVKALQQTVDLFAALRKNLEELVAEHGQTQTKEQRLASTLEAIANGLAAESMTHMPTRGSTRRRFEFVLGVDDLSEGENPYFWFLAEHPVPTADQLWSQAKLDEQLGVAAARTLVPHDYVARLQNFVADKCRSILSQSVIEVIKQNQEKARKENKDNPTPGLFKRALSRSTLLLPLRNEVIGLNRERSIKEFVIAGIGQPVNKEIAMVTQAENDQDFFEKALPDHEKEKVKVTFTSDPYQISFTRYLAIFPLHAVGGMADLRHAYNERVLPPSHIDRKDIFKLVDPLPEDEAHQGALKLLALSLMDCFGLIRHIHKEEGGSYFLPAESLWPSCQDRYDIEDKMPGTPGKFYSLVEQLSMPHWEPLRRAMRAELTRLAGAAELPACFFDEAKMLGARFQAQAESSAKGLADANAELPFNKMVTGRYYRREADFFNHLARHRPAIEKQLTSGRNLMDILFDRREGFAI